MNKYIREKIELKIKELASLSVPFSRDMDLAVDFADTWKPSVIEQIKIQDYDLSLSDIEWLISDLELFNKRSSNTKKVNGSFVVLSDFHSYRYPLDKIKNYYLNEYDVVFILGDACDRGADKNGSGGITILEEIKELSQKYPGRVIYVPGNHDSFIIGHADGDEGYTNNLISNGGYNTIKELKELEERDYLRYAKLISWLSKLPIQRVHEFQGQKFVLAHALFNQKLYNYNPNYCLGDLISGDFDDMYQRAYKAIWFRKGKMGYNPSELPNSDSIMVIGHTPVHKVSGTYDLEDANGNIVKVHCVDGGITFGHQMLKYDGGADTDVTFYDSHNDTSPKMDDADVIDIDKEREELFRYFILNSLLKDFASKGKSVKDYVYDVWDTIYHRRNIYGKYVDIINCNTISTDYYKANVDISRFDEETFFQYKFYDYVCIILLDYVIDNLMEKYENDISVVSDHIDNFLFENVNNPGYKGDLRWFSKYKNTRSIIEKLGSHWILRALRLHGCKYAHDYINNKYSYGSGFSRIKK